jgi:hypothetical protein
MMGCCAGFHANQTRGLLCEERQQLAPRQWPLDNDRSGSINAMHLKN